MCRLVVTIHACGCPGPKQSQARDCTSAQAMKTYLKSQPELRFRLARICMLDMNKGIITQRLDRVCKVCSQGVDPGDLILWPKNGAGEKASEEKGPSDLGKLGEETRLIEEESMVEGQQVSEEPMRAQEVRLAQEASGDGRGAEGSGGRSPTDDDEWSISLSDLEATNLPRTTEERILSEDWSMTSDGLAEAKGELAEEERRFSEDWSLTPDGMVEAEEELAEEERKFSEDWSLTPDGMVEAEEELANTERSWSIDWSVSSTELAEAKKEEEERMAEEDREIAGEERMILAMADDRYNITGTAMDARFPLWLNLGPRDKKAVEAPADGGAAGVPVAAPSGNDKPLPMAGVLEADRRGAMDTGTVTIPTKLVPRTDYYKVLSGMEDVAFIEEVADACTEEVEQWTEGGKIYLAVKAAMGDECVGTYQFVAGQVGIIITNFIICVIAAALRPLQKEQKKIKEEKKLARAQAWINESGAALATVWPGDVLGPTVWLEEAWALTGGGLQVDDFGGLNDAQTPLPSTLGINASPTSGRGRGAGRAKGSARARGGGRARWGGRARGSGRAGGNTGSRPPITDSAAGVATAPILPTVSKLLGPEASGNVRSTRRRGRPRGSRGRGRGRGRGGGTAETSTLPRPVDQSLMHYGPQLGKRNRSITPKTMVGYLQTTEGAAGGVAGAPILPPIIDKSLMSDGSELGKGNRLITPKAMGSSTGAVGGVAEAPILPPVLDKSQVYDGSQLGIKNRQSAPGAMGSHLQTTEGVAMGFPETLILPPTLDKSRMYDGSQLGIKNRQSATEGVVGGSAETRTLPETVDKSGIPDASQLGKRKRESDSKTVGGNLRKTEGAAEGPAEPRILPPTLDKPLMSDAAPQLGKRNREDASETIGTHLQTIEGATEGAAEGSKDAETPLQSSFGTDFRSDASQVSTRGGGRGRGRGRGRKRARAN
ncbi:hypothetical protein VC83_03257 [Pseudogymnoascus destructans]|uniref:Uncharacterized protein n=1 Tax=Pseudogymnoascus destructans TaxID=655981 RepID=A0A177AHE0_9PEZI|nr:uncharacterized protein VC83_03257 [Pseudogymnoascus destructans]OAF60594.1 hypothetical protein VC83_03257 [Pseudogymnoascus destructans]